jgi:hypothetical protein
MEKYINYLLESIIFDAQGYDHWWMWTIIPAFFYTLFLVLKYTVLTLPVWLPFNLILGALRKKEK